MTKQLEQDAINFINEVEAVAKDQGYQEAKSKFDAQLAAAQADFDKRIVEARETYYNEGFAEGYNTHKQEMESAEPAAPEPHEVMAYTDGMEYANDKAKLVASFSYSRKFPTNWGTLVLPVALDYADWSSKFEIAEITGVEVGTTIKAKRNVLGAGSKTLPNHVYLIRSKKSSTTAQVITKKNCTVYPSTPESLAFVEGGKKYTFNGTYVKLSAADLAGKYYSSNGVFVKATSSCNPMRVYLEISK